MSDTQQADDEDAGRGPLSEMHAQVRALLWLLACLLHAGEVEGGAVRAHHADLPVLCMRVVV